MGVVERSNVSDVFLLTPRVPRLAVYEELTVSLGNQVNTFLVFTLSESNHFIYAFKISCLTQQSSDFSPIGFTTHFLSDHISQSLSYL